MQYFLIILAIILCGVALRSFPNSIACRKLGTLCYLASISTAVYFLTNTLWISIAASFSWILLPWIELLTRIRNLRVPINNKLQHSPSPCSSHFPESEQTISNLEAEGFEHTSDAHWTWGDSSHYYSFYWHPEYKLVAAVCFCEQKHITFSFLTISSQDNQGTLWRSTNYPFSQNLKSPPHVRWNHIGCQTKCLIQIRKAHLAFIQQNGTKHSDLITPDPDSIEHHVEIETRRQIDFNLKHGIIRTHSENSFGYTIKGLFFLWGQVIKDIIKLF